MCGRSPVVRARGRRSGDDESRGGSFAGCSGSAAERDPHRVARRRAARRRRSRFQPADGRTRRDIGRDVPRWPVCPGGVDGAGRRTRWLRGAAPRPHHDAGGAPARHGASRRDERAAGGRCAAFGAREPAHRRSCWRRPIWRASISPASLPRRSASARAFWSRSRGLVFTASNLPAPPPGRAYQLWVLTAQPAPISAGMLKLDASGRATEMIDTPQDLPRPVAMAVTLEPEAGVPAPTGDKYLVGLAN